MKLLHLAAVAALLCSILTASSDGFAGEVGIFLSTQPTCKISTSGGSNSCRKDAAVSAGDIITTKQDPAALAIQWLAPTLVHLEPVAKGKYRVVFTPPPQKQGVVSMVADLLGFARRAGRVSHGAVTRGGPEAQPLLPGDGATLLPGQQVTFSWCADGVKQIVITTVSGAKVKEIAVPEGQRSLTVKPEELGLAAKVLYRWEPVGAVTDGGQFRLLDGEKAGFITDAIRLIDEGEGSAVVKGLKKAALLQFVSENYANDYTLGWLQYRLASELPSQLAADDRAAAERLKAESGVSSCR